MRAIYKFWNWILHLILKLLNDLIVCSSVRYLNVFEMWSVLERVGSKWVRSAYELLSSCREVNALTWKWREERKFSKIFIFKMRNIEVNIRALCVRESLVQMTTQCFRCYWMSAVRRSYVIKLAANSQVFVMFEQYVCWQYGKNIFIT